MNLFDRASPVQGFPVLDSIINQNQGLDFLKAALPILGPAQLTPATISNWLTSLDDGERKVIYSRSVERTSHFKWFLGTNSSGLIVWLHDYKPNQVAGAAGSFAGSIHNHRYSFVSRVLSGSLSVSDFAIQDQQGFPRLSGIRTIAAGLAYTLTADQIHRVDHTSPFTVTLVIQGPPEKPCSRVYDPATMSFEDMYDLPSLLPKLIDRLADE